MNITWNNDWMPPWWDLLTSMRLVGVLLFVLAWFLVGLLSAPWLAKKFNEYTRGYVRWMLSMFDRMFMTVKPAYCSASIAISMLLFALLGFWLTSAVPMSAPYHIIRAIVVSILVLGPFRLPLGYQLPRRIVKLMWNRRVRKFENQLLDALAFMTNGLRSGLSLVQCMEMVSQELADPISQEFALLLSEQRVGVTFDQALLNLEKRIGTEDLQILVTSINILRQSGGNLSDTFETIAYTIRERIKVEGRIRSLTAQGMAQAVIITIMPFALAFVLWTFDHELVSRLWTTWLGWILIGFMLTLQTIGGLLMRWIVRIRV